MARHGRSEQSTAEFCAAEGVSVASFYAWRRKLATPRPAKPAKSAFQQLVISESPTAVSVRLPDGGAVGGVYSASNRVSVISNGAYTEKIHGERLRRYHLTTQSPDIFTVYAFERDVDDFAVIDVATTTEVGAYWDTTEGRQTIGARTHHAVSDLVEFGRYDKTSGDDGPNYSHIENPFYPHEEDSSKIIDREKYRRLSGNAATTVGWYSPWSSGELMLQSSYLDSHTQFDSYGWDEEGTLTGEAHKPFRHSYRVTADGEPTRSPRAPAGALNAGSGPSNTGSSEGRKIGRLEYGDVIIDHNEPQNSDIDPPVATEIDEAAPLATSSHRGGGVTTPGSIDHTIPGDDTQQLMREMTRPNASALARTGIDGANGPLTTATDLATANAIPADDRHLSALLYNVDPDRTVIGEEMIGSATFAEVVGADGTNYWGAFLNVVGPEPPEQSTRILYSDGSSNIILRGEVSGATAAMLIPVGRITKAPAEAAGSGLVKLSEAAAKTLDDAAKGTRKWLQQKFVRPMQVAAPVKPGDTGTFGDLKSRKRRAGETEALDMDHQPSLAAQRKAQEDRLGRRLKPDELNQLKNNTPAVASPRKIHQQTSPTYGGRNTAERIAEDAADLDAAALRDRLQFDEAMRTR